MDPDPDPATQINADPDSDPDPKPWMEGSEAGSRSRFVEAHIPYLRVIRIRLRIQKTAWNQAISNMTFIFQLQGTKKSRKPSSLVQQVSGTDLVLGHQNIYLVTQFLLTDIV
jgi:hypothetical protein